MFPTIHRFMEGLLSPRTSLRTLSEARFAQDGTGALLLERTTLFAEAQCTLGDRRLRLFCPLSPLAHRLAGGSRSQRQSATQTATVCSRRSILCNGSWRRPA